MPNPNAGNPYMQGANPFMQDPPKPGSPQEQTPVDGGLADAGMAPMENGTSETTKPRQMPGGAPATPPGMDVGIGDPMAEPGGEDANAPQDSPPAQATAVLRRVRAEIRRDNPDVDVVDAHLMAQAVVDLIFTAAPRYNQPTPLPNSNVAPHPVPSSGTRYNRGRRVNPNNMGDLNDPRNPNSPLHPAHPMNPRRVNQQQDDMTGQNGEDNGRWQPQNGGYTQFDDKAYGAGYRGQYPYAAGAVLMGAEKIRDRWQNRRSGKTPPGQDHPDSRQLP